MNCQIKIIVLRYKKIMKKYYIILLSLFYTLMAKVRWGGSIRIDGLFRRRRDTQIIIEGGGKMDIGKAVAFQKRVSLTACGGELSIGSNVSFNRNCILICRDHISIGANTMFGPGVVLYDHDHNFSNKGIMPGYKHGNIIIENGCWIGANVIILRNTHIGEGCVIGAGTILRGDIPAHSLVTSNRELNIVPLEEKVHITCQ